MAELIVRTLDGSFRVYFLREIKTLDFYAMIKQKTFDEFYSDACHVLVERHLTQLRLRWLIQ